MIDYEQIQALITPTIKKEIISNAIKESIVLKFFKRLGNISSDQMELRILSEKPIVEWINTDVENPYKSLSSMAWDRVTADVCEMATIIPIRIANLEDAGNGEVSRQIIKEIAEASFKTVDGAIISGYNKPRKFRASLIDSILNAGKIITATGNTFEDINKAMQLVEESGYKVSAIMGGLGLNADFRGTTDTIGQPIVNPEITQLPRILVDSGAWDSTKAKLIVGDFNQAVYALRNSIKIEILTEATLQDPESKEILHNLAQENKIAFRASWRLTWALPNAVTNQGSTSFPFALVTAGTPATTYTVTFTVNDGTDPISGVKVNLGDMIATTGTTGVATFTVLGNNKFNYSVSKKGNATKTGTINVITSNVTITVSI